MTNENFAPKNILTYFLRWRKEMFHHRLMTQFEMNIKNGYADNN